MTFLPNRRSLRANTQKRERCGAALTCAYNRTEDIRIGAVVVAELKLSNVEREIFGADFVECADHAALEDRPEAFNRVRVNGADAILIALLWSTSGLRMLVVQSVIALPLVGREQANLVGHDLADKFGHVFFVTPFQNARYNVALALTAPMTGVLPVPPAAPCGAYSNVYCDPCRRPTFRPPRQCRQAFVSGCIIAARILWVIFSAVS